MPHDCSTKVQAIGERLVERRLRLAVMESCTGGMLATSISCTPGCGDYFLGGIVSYATESKLRFGVDDNIVRVHGVVSAETASEMARSAVREFEADVTVGLTGVAGPKPQDGAPVGRVFIAVALRGDVQTERFDFDGDPDEIKERAVWEALLLLERRVNQAVAR